MKAIKLLCLFVALVSCKKESTFIAKHNLSSQNDVLTIEYEGEGDVVQFKMFEGLHTILNNHGNSKFSSQVEVPNLDNAIFSYSLIIHKMDSLKKMHSVEYKPDLKDGIHFLWIGKNRNVDYKKSSSWLSKMKFDRVKSNYLNETREVTVYQSNGPETNKPILYLTDGMVVNEYAPYVDELINQNKIIPIDLVGIHASSTNRFEEYVYKGGSQNVLPRNIFNNHKDFFFNEVLHKYESENWSGDRYMYGYSNGAAFSMFCGINYPQHFKGILAFSTVGYISEFDNPIKFEHEEFPSFYLCAGKYEERIYNDNVNFLSKMKRNNCDVDFTTLIAGHDYMAWKYEFLNYLEKEFKK